MVPSSSFMCTCVCACVSRPFFTFSALVLRPLPVHQSRFLPLFLSLRAVLRAPIKESRPTPVCALDTIVSLFPSSRSPNPVLLLSLRRRLTPRRFPPYTPFVFSSVALGHHELPIAAVASRCILPRNCILHTRPRGRMEESLRSLGSSVCVRDRWRMK